MATVDNDESHSPFSYQLPEADARVRHLLELSASLTCAMTVEQVIDALMRDGLPTLGVKAGLLILLTDDGTEYALVRSVGYSPEVVAQYVRIPLDAPMPVPDAVRAGTPLFLHDLAAREQAYPGLGRIRVESGDGAMAALPLKAGGDYIGGIALFWPDRQEFPEAERTFLIAVAQTVALALERARLQEAERKARHEAEARLREGQESQRILDALMEYIPEGISIANTPDVTIRMASRYGQQLSGRGEKKQERVPLEEHAAPLKVFRTDGVTLASLEEMPLLRAAKKGEVVYNEEWVFERPDGKRVTVLSNAGPIYDEEGNLTGGIVAWRDITERKRMEDALRESEEHLRYIVEFNPQVPWTAGPDGGIRDFSQRWLDLTGLTREQALGGGWMQAPHEDDLPAMAHAWTHSVQTGEPYDVEHRIRLADGSYRWMRSRAFPRRDSEGNILLWYGATEDIHAYKEAEQALRQSEQQFRAVFENAAVGMDITSLTGEIEVSNAALQQFLGYSEAEMHKMPCSAFSCPDDAVIEKALLGELIAGKRDSYQMLKRFIHKDGKLMWGDLTVSVVRDDAGTPLHFIAVVQDVTERKQFEAQFIQAQKMEGIGRLAGGVAHDFNNLLSIILGYGELAQQELDAEVPAQACLTNIQNAATRAATLTQQLLAFARRQNTEPRLLHLNTVLKAMSALLPPLIGEHIQTVWTLHAEHDLIKADPNQIEQVLVNLAVNARDAMPEGGRLTIRTETVTLVQADWIKAAQLGPGEYVCLSVTDTGCGMNEEVKSRIFEPFFTTKEQGQGTGLGLATCYGIVKQNGGYIWVYSEQGVGTTFKVYLPCAEGHALAAETERASTPLTGSETVLLVEDEEAVRQLASVILRNGGYTVVEAKNGEEALQLAEAHVGTLGLVLTDMVMPVMGGMELARQLRERYPDLPVLFMSGYNPEAIPGSHFRDGEAVMLEKPFTSRTLLSRVHDALKKKKPPSIDPL